MFLLFCCGVFSVTGGCREAPPSVVPSPRGYDLAAPKKFVMSESLREISGIVLLAGNPDTMYAIEDETGKLYYFHLGDGKFPFRRFGAHGDYEDVTILDNKEFVVLRSDGSLFVFPVGVVGGERPGLGGERPGPGGERPGPGSERPAARHERSAEVRSYEHILPAGEYEGLFGDDSGRLIAMCKNCPIDDQQKEVSVYVLQYGPGHALAISGHFRVEVPADKLTSIHRKIKFHPSCVARHPLTREWYIISSVNKVLIVLDERWKVKGMYALDPELFKQPEGLAFDRRGNMYISNEGGKGNANVLLFPYKL
jgi:SdiA-regulated